MLGKLIYMLFLIIIFIGIIIASIILYKKSSKENNFKKKMLFAIPTILYCCVVIVVLLISKNVKLSYVEEQVYDKVVSMVNEDGFFNPQEARLLEVVVGYKYNDVEREYSDTIEEYHIKIVGTNKVGGTINKCYRIYYSDYMEKWNNRDEDCEDIYQTSKGYEELSSVNIKNINNALQEYWENLGL